LANLDLNTIVQVLIQAIEKFWNHYPYMEGKQHLILDCKWLLDYMHAMNQNEYEQKVSENDII
jgi:hypothetical protein